MNRNRIWHESTDRNGILWYFSEDVCESNHDRTISNRSCLGFLGRFQGLGLRGGNRRLSALGSESSHPPCANGSHAVGKPGENWGGGTVGGERWKCHWDVWENFMQMRIKALVKPLSWFLWLLHVYCIKTNRLSGSLVFAVTLASRHRRDFPTGARINARRQTWRDWPHDLVRFGIQYV